MRLSPPCSFGDDENPLGRLLRDEQYMAADRKAVARIREVIVGICLVGFAASVLMILWGAFTALDHAP